MPRITHLHRRNEDYETTTSEHTHIQEKPATPDRRIASPQSGASEGEIRQRFFPSTLFVLLHFLFFPLLHNSRYIQSSPKKRIFLY
jgi:hypothetical protein